MTAPAFTRDSVNDFLADHRELMHEIAAVRTLWSEVDQLGDGPRYAEMSHALGAIRPLLAKHFQEEEAGGYLAPALAIAPRFSELASQLQNDHARFLETLDGLITELDGVGFDDWAAAGAVLEQFQSDLARHEAAENRIVQSAFNEDIGSGD